MAEQTRKLLIAGNYGFGNAGDEAILGSMLVDLRERVSGLRAVVVSGRPEQTAQAFGVEAIHWQDVSAIVAAVRATDLVVLGGGGLFADYWGTRLEWQLSMHHSDLGYYTEFAVLAAVLDKPFMIYAAGVGPLHSAEARELTCMAFEQADVATVRDEASKDVLASLGVDPAVVRVTADPAFRSAGWRGTGRVDDLLGTRDAGRMARPWLGVALRNWDVNVDPATWESRVAAALDAFVDDRGGTVIFVALQSMDGLLTDDLAVATRVRGGMRHRASTVPATSNASPDDVMAVLGECDLVLAMRMHSAILAAANGVPAVALAYDPKLVETMSSLSAGDFVLDLRALTIADLARLLRQALDGRPEMSSRIRERFDELAGRARVNAELAAELVERPASAGKGLSQRMAERLKSLTIAQALRGHDLELSARSWRSRAEESARSSGVLQEQLTERNLAALALQARVDALNGQLEERAHALRMAESQGELRVKEIHALQHALNERSRELQTLAAEAEHRLHAIDALAQELALIRNSRGWAWLQRLRRVRAVFRRRSA